MAAPPRPAASVVLLLAACLFGAVGFAQAQNNLTQATTDPDEARALNSIFQQWRISANQEQWNISGDPCSGAAVDQSIDWTNGDYNPFMKCDCSCNNNTVCHITQLKVYAMDAVGVLPDELWTLTYLTNLNLDQNLLSGPVSPSIGNLTRLQTLSFGINALSGQLPREVGRLPDITVIGMGGNNFSGPLPSELGNCSNLQQIYMDSSGISGEIPPSFANLQNMQILWASDTRLTGRIPDFIGNWTQLTTLRFQGNAFEGPIPASFSSLTSLQELRISDLANGSSSLAFIRDMRSLGVLELRNNNISNRIPSNIGEYQSLKHLDLSFNNINGEIPRSLFDLSSLTHLFLGNNSLNGTLPAVKSPTLQNIDVSYNNLGGSFPSWINERNLQLNLVANNFMIESSISSNLLSGLNCLQRNFPCNRGRGIYFNFGANSGGPQITSSSGLVFENDSRTLGPASYFVTDSRRWGVSNVGYFTGNDNPQYTVNSLSQFTNTLDSELFQTARLSASSLRYYGLGLENGNYTVTLQFAETVISDTRSWKSLGRRVFDVYVQGNRVLRDFDIMRAADGISRRAIQRAFRAQVRENYIEVHLFWAGKGTCCIPRQGTYGPLISAISARPDFTPTVSNNPPSTGQYRTVMIVGIVVGVGLILLSVLAIFCVLKRRRRLTDDDEELIGLDAKPFMFSYSELRTATEDFSPANKLGEGGFGPVYKGKLGDGRAIAVKQLSVASRQGKSQFVAEIATISEVQHRNLVRLYGCCLEGTKKLLVYEYLENKSLDQALFEKSNLQLNWPIRYDICLGVARGLTYLHEESRLRIIHRDVKSSNILLDADLVPKISDFGLAKLYDDKKTHISTRVAGTIGYLAPEYAMRGHLTEKTDVFAFGVVALEVVGGRANSDTSLEEDKIYLLEWAWNLHENNREVELVDSRLSEFNEEEVKRLIGVALLCTQTTPTLRPSMSRVYAMLSGDTEVPQVTSRPGYLTDWRFDDTTTNFMSADGIIGTDTSSLINSSTSGTTETDHLPKSASNRVLHDLIGEGR